MVSNSLKKTPRPAGDLPCGCTAEEFPPRTQIARETCTSFAAQRKSLAASGAVVDLLFFHPPVCPCHVTGCSLQEGVIKLTASCRGFAIRMGRKTVVQRISIEKCVTDLVVIGRVGAKSRGRTR